MLKKLILFFTVAVMSLSAYLMYRDKHAQPPVAVEDKTVFAEALPKAIPGVEIK